MDLPTQGDWAKVTHILSWKWPRSIPECLVVNTMHTTLDRMQWWFDQAHAAPWIVIDTEYVPTTQYIYLIGLGAPTITPTLQLDMRGWGGGQGKGSGHGDIIGMFVKELYRLIQQVPVVFHNALADVPVLRHKYGWDWDLYRQIEDTMQAHAVLYPGWDHDLGFLASVWGRYPKTKHLARENPRLYNQGDVLETISMWAEIEKEFERDPKSEKVYREEVLPLLPHIDQSHVVGLRVNQDAVGPHLRDSAAKKEAATAKAQAYCGYPISLSSDAQVAQWLYKMNGFTMKRNRATVDAETIEMFRREHPDHPLLEARVAYDEADRAMTQYLQPLIVKE